MTSEIADMLADLEQLNHRWAFRRDEPEAKAEEAAFQARKRALFARIRAQKRRI